MYTKYNGGWPGGPQTNFNEICYSLVNQIDVFKRHRAFTGVIGNDVRDGEIGITIYETIKNTNPKLLDQKYIDKFLQNDKIGNPIIHEIYDLNISTGTLIFMNHLNHIISNFFDIKSIVEIGSGYGGQCKIIKDFIDADYTCIDIPGCLELCKTYLGKLEVNANFIDSNNVPELYTDLVISNFCLNELDEVGIDFYFDRIIKNSKYIYIAAGNFQNIPRNNYLLQKCTEYFDITVHQETPKITKHNNIFIIGKKINV